MVKCTCICLIVHICVHLGRVINSSETCGGKKNICVNELSFLKHKQTGFDGTPQTSSSVRIFLFVCFFDLSCSVFYFPWPMRAMRHHWLLLGACGWVLLILMFVSKLITFRAVDGKTSPCRVPSELPEDSLTPLTLSHTTLSLSAYTDYGDRAAIQKWTVPGTKVIKPAPPASSPGKPEPNPKPSHQVIDLVLH